MSPSVGERRTKPGTLTTVRFAQETHGTTSGLTVFSFPRLIVVPVSSHEVDGVRKEKERLTAAGRE